MADKVETELKTLDYYGALDKIRKKLEREVFSDAETEALLIYAVKKARLTNARRDEVLMALSLLKDFDNRLDRSEGTDDKKSYSNRRDTFLKNTNYIETQTEGKYKTYSAVRMAIHSQNEKTGERKTELEVICETLDTKTTRSIQRVIEFIYNNANRIDQYLREAKKDLEKNQRKDKTRENPWRQWKHIPTALLPVLEAYKWTPSEGTQEFAKDPTEQGTTGTDTTGKKPNESAHSKQRVDFWLDILRIIATTIILVIFIITVGSVKLEIPTSNGPISIDIDFSVRDYTADRQPGKEVAESICNPGSIPVSPTPPLGGNSDDAKVVDGSLDSID